MRCSECGTPLPADADPRRVTCSAKCRSARKRRRDLAEVARLRALVAASGAETPGREPTPPR